mmetsp:Transcript_70473/g.183548  ORF Transcript_70473/g.183548 Transcript_70473/m.183548 type:complete len:563 (-) Transcript_70473:73-1761(-)
MSTWSVPSRLRCCLLLVVCADVPAVLGSDDEVCPADAPCASSRSAGEGIAAQGEYYWPQGKGHPRHYGQSPYSFGGASCNLSANLRWSWQHPDGRYNTIITGKPLIDNERNIYISSLDGIHKFDIDGRALWTWSVSNYTETRNVPNNPAIMDGRLYNCLTTGELFALSMETGELLWEVKASEQGIGEDTAFVTATRGIVLLDVDPPQPGGSLSDRQNNRIVAFNSSDGSELWDFMPDVGVWNFLPHFPDDGTAVFQTWNGGAYRLNLSDGTPIWSQGVDSNVDGWTDGGPALGPNGLFYTTRSEATMEKSPFSEAGSGGLAAYRVSDGELVWNRSGLEQGIYTYPVVGRLAEGAPLSVVTGVGSLAFFPLQIQFIIFGALPGAMVGFLIGMFWALCKCRGMSPQATMCAFLLRPLVAAAVCALLGSVAVVPFLKGAYPYSVQAFDAETGEPQWRVELPTWRWYCAAGDEEGLATRRKNGHRQLCLPPASSYMTLDAQGAIYFGHLDGRLYRIKDWNGDGRIDAGTEVCAFEAGSGFLTGGPSIAPGVLAVASCDTLYVFGDA